MVVRASIGVMILSHGANTRHEQKVEELEEAYASPAATKQALSDVVSYQRQSPTESWSLPSTSHTANVRDQTTWPSDPLHWQQRPESGGRKTPKRAAAEAKLADRYTVGEGLEGGTERGAKRSKVSPRRSDALFIPSCPESCTSESGAMPDKVTGWCSFGVSLQHTNWQAAIDSMAACIPEQPQGSQARSYSLNEGVRIIVVEDLSELQPALDELRASMHDEVISIDLEWRPTFKKHQKSRVAMVQLASSKLAVLVRTCIMKCRKVGARLQDFLSDPVIVVVGFGWDGCDEGKMTETFGFGRRVMSRFLDLQTICAKLGYGSNMGLGKLTQQVMGITIPKDKKTTMSNWEQRSLTPKHFLYAAMDALITGEVLRALRLWHSHPSDCSGCSLPLGSFPQQACRGSVASPHTSRKAFSNASCRSPEHGAQKCQSCGRLSQGMGTQIAAKKGRRKGK